MSITTSPRVGGDFGDYRIDALLGRGAMGVVYRALAAADEPRGGP